MWLIDRFEMGACFYFYWTAPTEEAPCDSIVLLCFCFCFCSFSFVAAAKKRECIPYFSSEKTVNGPRAAEVLEGLPIFTGAPFWKWREEGLTVTPVRRRCHIVLTHSRSFNDINNQCKQSMDDRSAYNSREVIIIPFHFISYWCCYHLSGTKIRAASNHETNAATARGNSTLSTSFRQGISISR